MWSCGLDGGVEGRGGWWVAGAGDGGVGVAVCGDWVCRNGRGGVGVDGSVLGAVEGPGD